jgi:predicted  nucleic acid-binding Zn-ribbon protein
MTLKDKIKLLTKLQECDNRIQAITKQKEQGPLRIQVVMEEMKIFELKLKENGDHLESLKKERRRLEQEIQDHDGKIEKSNAKLFNIKSNKEYTAALKEVEDLKRLKFVTEEKALQIMEEIEAREGEQTLQKGGLQDLKIKIEKEKSAIEKQLLLLDGELQVHEKERAELVTGLDQDLWKKYLFLKEKKGGLAVSAVRGGVCQTCHIGIPPQKFNELIKGDAIMSCPHCNRIIYWGEDKDFQAQGNMI